ncbi:MAG: FAD-dependent oxidoreductase, partial [Planctomycetota bacterium]
RARTRAIGMRFLRSPVMHHIDVEPYSLAHFAAASTATQDECFTPPNDRPSLELFNAHSVHVLRQTGLGQRHVRGEVERVTLAPERVTVGLRDGSHLTAKRAVLSIGEGDGLARPDWARVDDARLVHAFDDGLDVTEWEPGRVCVVGAGITGGHMALHLASHGHTVALVSRHLPRVKPYDSDPGWFGPKYMRAYDRLNSHERRRWTIQHARNRGSMTPGLYASVREAIKRGEVQMHVSTVKAVDTSGAALGVTLGTGQAFEVDRVVCATGFPGRRPGGAMVEDLIQRHDLAVAPCGFPIVDAALRWHPRLHVTGALADLEIGPVARNIAGARKAADRILRGGRELVGVSEPVKVS